MLLGALHLCPEAEFANKVDQSVRYEDEDDTKNRNLFNGNIPTLFGKKVFSRKIAVSISVKNITISMKTITLRSVPVKKRAQLSEKFHPWCRIGAV